MRVFSKDWVNGIRKRFEKLPEYQKPFIYTIAIADDHRGLRHEIEAWVDALRPEAQDAVVPRLRDTKQFLETYNTLAFGVLLKEKLGFKAQYEIPFGNLTPDWTVQAKGQIPEFIVEVFTDNPPKHESATARRRAHLYKRLRQIDAKVGLSIEAQSNTAPSEEESKRIASEVRQWLTPSLPPPGSEITVAGMVFRVMGETGTSDHPQILGEAEWFSVNPKPLIAKVMRKLKRYKRLGESGIPLTIGIITTIRTGRGLDTFKDVFLGQEVAQLEFSDRGETTHAVSARQADGLLSQGNCFLSAVIWMQKHIGGEYQFSAIHNQFASNPLPPDTFTSQQIEGLTNDETHAG